MDVNDWLQTFAEASSYPESVICLHVAIFSNHNTCIVTRASQKRGKHLIEMLTEKHPEIDTAGGRILSGTLEEVQSVLIELIGETKKQGRLEARTGNMVVDSMVNHAWKTAVENGIIFHADIAPLPELSIKDADLCVLLGNAFDNALEASRFVEEGSD